MTFFISLEKYILCNCRVLETDNVYFLTFLVSEDLLKSFRKSNCACMFGPNTCCDWRCTYQQLHNYQIICFIYMKYNTRTVFRLIRNEKLLYIFVFVLGVLLWGYSKPMRQKKVHRGHTTNSTSLYDFTCFTN